MCVCVCVCVCVCTCVCVHVCVRERERERIIIHMYCSSDMYLLLNIYNVSLYTPNECIFCVMQVLQVAYLIMYSYYCIIL